MSEEIEFTHPFLSSCGKEYLIDFAKFQNIEDYDFELPVIDISLVLSSEVGEKKDCLKIADLRKITRVAIDYISCHDVALYYYCAHAPIPHNVSNRNSTLTPQEYRSILFGKLFESCGRRELFVKHDININDTSNGNHFISLISKQEHKAHLTKISQKIESFNDK